MLAQVERLPSSTDDLIIPETRTRVKPTHMSHTNVFRHHSSHNLRLRSTPYSDRFRETSQKMEPSVVLGHLHAGDDGSSQVKQGQNPEADVPIRFHDLPRNLYETGTKPGRKQAIAGVTFNFGPHESPFQPRRRCGRWGGSDGHPRPPSASCGIPVRRRGVLGVSRQMPNHPDRRPISWPETPDTLGTTSDPPFYILYSQNFPKL